MAYILFTIKMHFASKMHQNGRREEIFEKVEASQQVHFFKK